MIKTKKYIRYTRSHQFGQTDSAKKHARSFVEGYKDNHKATYTKTTWVDPIKVNLKENVTYGLKDTNDSYHIVNWYASKNIFIDIYTKEEFKPNKIKIKEIE